MRFQLSLIVALFLLCFHLFAFAEPAIRSQIESAVVPSGADFMTIFDSTEVDVQESGLSYVRMHKLVKIGTSKGAGKFRVITLGYDPLSAYVEIQKVTVYKKDGSIIEISTDAVQDYPAPARMIYWGAREKMLRIGRLEPGDAVDLHFFRKGFTYALLTNNDDERYIPPMKGHFYDIVPFWSNEPILEKVYQVLLPKDKFLQYEFYNGEVTVSSKLVDNKKQFMFRKTGIQRFKREPDMVAVSDEAPKLLLSTSPDWQAKSRWFYGVNEDYGSFESTPEITAFVEELLQGLRTEEEKIHRLTHWVADEIRYSGLSMGPGEGYTLHTGEMTFRDRCGVCKDKAGMLVTMLRAAGFESYAAMTMAGSRIDRIPADQFNHSVTIVKRSDGTYQLLDPTWVPFVRELWSSAEQQQQYLMGLPEGADLATTPISPPENHYYRIRGQSELLASGTLKGEFTIELEGQSDAVMRRMFTRQLQEKWKTFIESQLLQTAPKMVINKISYPDPYDYSEPFLATISYEIPDYALLSSDKMSFTPFSALLHFRHRYLNDHLFKNTGLSERAYAFRTRCSKLIDIEEIITLPAKSKVLYKPAVEDVAGSGGSFQTAMKLNGEQIAFSQLITFPKRIYQPEDWPSYRSAVLAQKEMAEAKVVLELTAERHSSK